MKHYDVTEWTDFVRGVADPARQRAMEDHLATGCGRCGRIATALRRVVEAGANELRHQPPDYAVRSVKAFFGLHRPERAPGWATTTLPLTFDSALAPASAGTRTLEDRSRQLLFESDDFALDVRLQRQSGDREAMVVGQLLKRPAEPVANAPAYLVCDGAIASSGFTGEFGGFRMDCPRQGALDLWLFVSDTERIAVTLDAGDLEPQETDPEELH